MEPTLHDGDRVVLRYDVPPRVGDIHVIRLPDAPDGPRPLAIKRITKRDGAGWFVEGDNLGVGVDSWTVGSIASADVLARVLVTVPNLARIRATVSQLGRR